MTFLIKRRGCFSHSATTKVAKTEEAHFCFAPAVVSSLSSRREDSSVGKARDSWSEGREFVRRTRSLNVGSVSV